MIFDEPIRETPNFLTNDCSVFVWLFSNRNFFEKLIFSQFSLGRRTRLDSPLMAVAFVRSCTHFQSVSLFPSSDGNIENFFIDIVI